MILTPKFKKGDKVIPVKPHREWIYDDPQLDYNEDMEEIAKRKMVGTIAVIDESFEYPEDGEEYYDEENDGWAEIDPEPILVLTYFVKFKGDEWYHGSYWYKEEWIEKYHKPITIDDIMDVVKEKPRVKKLQRVIGFQIGRSQKVIAIVKEARHKRQPKQHIPKKRKAKIVLR